MNNLAVIPARGGSTRVPGKNMLDFFGKPMFVHTCDHAKNSGLFSEIIVSSESDEILKISAEHGYGSEYRRPEKLAPGSVAIDDVVMDVIRHFDERGIHFDNVCLLWATAPMRDAEDIQKAYEMLTTSEVDAIIAATDYYYSPYCAVAIEENHRLRKVLPDQFWLGSQGWPQTLTDCGAMAWLKAEAYMKNKSWFPENSGFYHLPRYKAVDLDTQEDLDLLRLYYRHYVLKDI